MVAIRLVEVKLIQVIEVADKIIGLEVTINFVMAINMVITKAITKAINNFKVVKVAMVMVSQLMEFIIIIIITTWQSAQVHLLVDLRTLV